MVEYNSFFQSRACFRLFFCVVIFFYLLICYNGLWNMALYPTDANYAETLRSFLDVCQILTPATLIAVSFGALSVLELFCMVANNDRKTIVGMILWSLLTILMNSFLAYFISTGYRLSIGIWTILITTSIVSVIWYISMIILLNGSKYIQK